MTGQHVLGPGMMYVACVDGPRSRVISFDTVSLPILDFAHDVGN